MQLVPLHSGDDDEPSSMMSVHAISVAVASILLKELAFRLTISVGIRLKSQVLIANAWHHRSDALSSIAALAGVLGAVFGYHVLDVFAGVVAGGCSDPSDPSELFKSGPELDLWVDTTVPSVDNLNPVDP